LSAKDVVDVCDEEASVLEVSKETEIEDDADRQNGAGSGARKPAIDDQLAEAVIDRHREQKQQEIYRPPPRIVDERSQHEPGNGPQRLGRALEQQVSRQDDRQEAENEHIRVEQHSASPTILPPRSRASAGSSA
jgi:hypothetical protein